MSSCINFNPAFGDISLIGNDIEITRDSSNTTYQNVIRLFKTNKNDYELFSTYGLNIENFFGRPVSELLGEEIKSAIEDALIKNEIPGSDNVEILYLVEINTIHIRIILPGIDTIGVDFLQEKGFELE